METLKLYAVLRNVDQTEGRGPMEAVYYTKNKELASQIAHSPDFYRKYGVMGCGSGEVREKNIVILDSFQDFIQVENQNQISAALNKLTEKEKELLGLNK